MYIGVLVAYCEDSWGTAWVNVIAGFRIRKIKDLLWWEKNILTGSCLGWPKCQSRNLWDLSSNSRSSDLWLCGTCIDDAFMMHGFIACCWVTLIIWFVAFPYPENIAVAIGDHDPWFKVKNTWNHQPNILALKPMVLTEAVIKDTSQQHYPCHQESHGRASLVKNQNCCGCWGPLNPLISPNPECTHTIFVYHICALLCQHAYLAAVPSRMTRTTRFSPFWCRVLWLWHFCTATDEIVACLWAPPSLVFYHLTKGRTRLRSPQPEKKLPIFPCETIFLSKHQSL